MNSVMSEHESAALVAEMFDHFCAATTMRQILGLYRNMCDIIGVRASPFNEFYPKFKGSIRNWKAQALWKKFDARASHKVYNKGTACCGTRVLVIGGGPCGLRTAIEAQLLGAKVVLIEKRDRITRNNVLHLWPYLITDLKALGAKKFYGKFCAGSIDHISIRQLQCILMKVALLLGVEMHEGVSYLNLAEPKDGCGWRANISPEDHAVSHYEFDVIIGADGKRNTLEGFRRKEFRGKLAIAITANFINKKTEAETKVEEISGVAFIFNQSFFKELYQTTGIDLENIVYYKDETHYFVMTAKKHSLLDKGVILHDYSDPAELLASVNVDTNKLLAYAREAAEFSTKYQMTNLEFAVNHYGKPDVAMFDFTSMFAADNSCRMTVRKNYRLLSCLVGDSLLEPFWPTGSGCARGFLSSMDAAYAIKLFSNAKNSSLAVIAQRESIYRILAQTTPENLHRDVGSYTVDPSTRYRNLNKASVHIPQIKHLLDTDDPSLLEQTHLDSNIIISASETMMLKRKRRTVDTAPIGTVLLRWIRSQLKDSEFINLISEVHQCFTSGRVLCALIDRYRPDLVDLTAVANLSAEEANEFAFNIFEQELGIPRALTAKESIHLEKIDSKIWLNYLEQVVEMFRGEIPHVKHPKLDFAEFKQAKQSTTMEEFAQLQRFALNKKAAEASWGRKPAEEKRVVSNVQESAAGRRAKKRRSHEKAGGLNIDRGRDVAFPYPKGGQDGQFSDRIKSMEQQITSKGVAGSDKKPKDLLRAIGKIDSSDWNVKEIEKKIEQSRKTSDVGKSKEKVPKWSREQFLARQNKLTQPDDVASEKFKEFDNTLKSVDKQLKEGHNLDLGERGRNKVASIAGQFKPKADEGVSRIPKSSKPGIVLSSKGLSEKCHFCKQRVYLMEKISAEGLTLHRSCLKCHHCHTNLRLGGYAFDRDNPEGRFYCTQHFKLPPKSVKPASRKSAPRTSHVHHREAAPGTPDKSNGVATLDLLDRGHTPERIEFENAEDMSEGEDGQEEIDENEWTDRNFGTESDNSDEQTTSSSDDDSESDSDIFEDPIGSPLGAQTLQLASDWIDKRYSNMVDSDDEFYEYSSEDDDADSQTEGEEFAKAREMRMQEVKVMPPPAVPTDTETEGQSDLESSSEEVNSATEISTDSEFDQDPVSKEPPKIFIDDSHLRRLPTKVHVRQGIIENNRNRYGQPFRQSQVQQSKERDIHLEFKPLVEVDPTIKLTTIRAPLQNPRPGDYLLSKTASTEGIASKMSLELKKRYLLGETAPPGVHKSGSTSALDSKLKSFHSNISECQKLLHPAPEISPTMQTFLNNTAKLSEISTKLGILKKELSNENGNEKENVYDGNVNAKNEINLEKSGKDFSKMAPTTPNNKVFETIDLITPNKHEQENGHKDEIRKDTSEKKEEILKNKPLFIDLTADTPIQDRSLVETTLNFSFSPIKKSPTSEEPAKENIPDLISSVNNNKKPSPVEEDRSRSPAQDTTIVVPKLHPWTISNPEDMESDSLSETSSSSTSSVEDIPHFILDSTTSPETQNGGERFVPRLEVRNTSGELMQIDSLMIIDGKYVGDPEDLKVSEKLPEGTQIPSLNVNIDDDCKDSIVLLDDVNEPDEDEEDTNKDRNSISENESEKKLIISENSDSSKKNECDTSSTKSGPIPAIRTRSYEATFSARKLPTELKFDTKNENKIETLKNMPFIIENKQVEKPKTLSLGLQEETMKVEESDGDKTPMATTMKELEISDSETEMTGQNLTETELSDWNADDAVSENFVDIEFALNSNKGEQIKGTIKRNKKARQKKSNAHKSIKTVRENDNNNLRPQIKPVEHGIIKNLDIEDIEFMDTGSEEESLKEAYSTTNKAMLKNRGYVEFVDTHSHLYHSHSMHHPHNISNYRQSSGYTIIQPKLVEAINKQVPRVDYIEQGACLLNNDHDLKTPMNEELPKIAFEIKAPVSNMPLIGRQIPSISPDQQIDSLNDIEEDSLLIITSSPQAITTEESEVTIQEKVVEPQKVEEIVQIEEKTEVPVFKRQESQDKEEEKVKRPLLQKEKVEDIGYEEYVKRLQHKIAQISNARDSLEVKKSRRKSSKGEILDSSISSAEPSKPLTVFEPESVGRKIKELTKERVKQKDIIHDLVMDKLQTKKQLNAEKRLNRSRNRSNFLDATSGGHCENFPHYHPVPPERTKKPQVTTSSEETVRPFLGSVGRSLSNNIPTEEPKKTEAIIEKSPSEPTKLMKAQSFTYSSMKFSDYKENIGFSTPIPPPRINRKADETLTMTEKLRQDARARAKMKSNQDLGLSPEDRMQLLRKKYHINMQHCVNDRNKSDDIKFREQKLMSSKSVNDVSRVNPDIDLKMSEEIKLQDYISDPNLTQSPPEGESVRLRNRTNVKDRERRKSIIEKVSDFFNKKKESSTESSPTKEQGVFGRFKIASKSKDKAKDKEGSPYYERCASEDCLKNNNISSNSTSKTNESSPNYRNLDDDDDDVIPPPIPPLPLNYQRSDDESCTTNESRNEIKKLRAMSKASRQGELKRLRIAQEIQREQEEIEVQIKELELRGVDIEKKLRGEVDKVQNESSFGVDDELLLKELLDIMNNITSLKVRDDELSIRQQELQLEHRHAQLKEELNMRLSCSKLDKNSSDVAAEGAILNEMLEIVAKRQALRPSESRDTTAVVAQLRYAKDTDV